MKNWILNFKYDMKIITIVKKKNSSKINELLGNECLVEILKIDKN